MNLDKISEIIYMNLDSYIIIGVKTFIPALALVFFRHTYLAWQKRRKIERINLYNHSLMNTFLSILNFDLHNAVKSDNKFKKETVYDYVTILVISVQKFTKEMLTINLNSLQNDEFSQKIYDGYSKVKNEIEVQTHIYGIPKKAVYLYNTMTYTCTYQLMKQVEVVLKNSKQSNKENFISIMDFMEAFLFTVVEVKIPQMIELSNGRLVGEFYHGYSYKLDPSDYQKEINIKQEEKSNE